MSNKLKEFLIRHEKAVVNIIIALIVSFLVYGMINSKIMNDDLKGRNGVLVEGIITEVRPSRNGISVDVSFEYKGKSWKGSSLLDHNDSLENGVKVLLKISKKHPDVGYEYIGVKKRTRQNPPAKL